MRLARRLAVTACFLLLPATLATARDDSAAELLKVEETGRHGGRLVVALRAEPRTFNPVIAVDNPSLTVIRRMTADLVHTDRARQVSVPALAKSFDVSPDGRRFTLELRRGIRFSDGHPLDADDILFTFRVYLDEKVGSPNRSLLIVGGEPIRVEKLSSHRLAFELAEPYAVGTQIFDSIAILPEHRLGEAYREGRFAEAWGLDTPPEELVGLGPFRLKRYVAGERVELERNPEYWKVDPDGERLPFLDELVVLFIPSEDARVIRFKSGEIDVISRLSAESYDLLTREAAPSYELRDLGPGLAFEFLFFNLNDGLGERLPEVAAKQAWFRDRAFRQAISRAIDRAGVVRLVYRGKATAVASHVSPGNTRWALEDLEPPRRSVEAAKKLLAGAGFTWDDAGRLHDAAGRRVSFSVVTNSSNDARVRMAAILQEDLRELGIEVQVAALEFRALIDRLLNTRDYEAAILGLTGGEDPNQVVNIWSSGGSNHFWRLEADGPIGPWQEEIDRLLEKQVTTIDHRERKKLFGRVQRILAEEEPVVLLVSPNVLVGANRRLGNFQPVIFDHPTLWNADEIYWLSPSPVAPTP